MPLLGFEPAIPSLELLQTYALDRTAMRIGISRLLFQWLDRPLGAYNSSFFDASRSHLLDTPHSVGLLWTSDQLVAETST
jgi:hypothetical protein